MCILKANRGQYPLYSRAKPLADIQATTNSAEVYFTPICK